MSKTAKTLMISDELVMNKIYFIRGQKVMLDRDLAELYQVETRTLNQAVRRNIDRFPGDFMFQLTELEFQDWKSQIVISNSERMGLRKLPFIQGTRCGDTFQMRKFSNGILFKQFCL